ncbi:661_t:CDS:1 [Cetraspora pellucida]|uniref:661_t:CDS:1 n=1 Tax=Cetraspora pellucida TaxID=1433469 RepID=A0A9N9KIM2_9GLOM|nr:661_t:CDS:1 [Cetraspora pellucida]
MMKEVVSLNNTITNQICGHLEWYFIIYVTQDPYYQIEDVDTRNYAF